MRPSTIVASILGLLGVGAAGCLAYGVFVEVNAFTLRRVRVPVLPPDHEPVTILHISDLHLLASQTKKVAWVRGLAELHPDFVINTGDNMAEPDALLALARALTPLSDVPGIYVLGSNDFHGARPINPLSYLAGSSAPYLHPANRVEPTREPNRWVESLFAVPSSPEPRVPIPTDAIEDLFDSAGWANAEGSGLRYTIRDTTIEFRGCSDAHMGHDNYPDVMGDCNADLLIGVTHSPYQKVLNHMVEDGAELIFAGHTHGGQVCLPGGHALTTNCDLPRGKAKGLSTHRHGDGETYLHVSGGLGTSPKAPYRFCCPPEATLLRLVPKA
ncbi:MAG: metallophosphoesterase [Propionibacteriaceae bacterium]|jgi:predicted MPP superfamily phosphohydrolase|nr:metallophosphoesterase [Propionibacteriaceae bacterium]